MRVKSCCSPKEMVLSKLLNKLLNQQCASDLAKRCCYFSLWIARWGLCGLYGLWGLGGLWSLATSPAVAQSEILSKREPRLKALTNPFEGANTAMRLASPLPTNEVIGPFAAQGDPSTQPTTQATTQATTHSVPEPQSNVQHQVRAKEQAKEQAKEHVGTALNDQAPPDRRGDSRAFGRGEQIKQRVVWEQTIRQGDLLHLALEALASAAGWTFIWYPSVSWRAVADIDLRAYSDPVPAVIELVRVMRQEGKPIQLRLSKANQVMEVLSTEVVHD